MTEIIRKICHGYIYLFEELPDPRTKSLFLVAKPYQGIVLLSLYLMFVFKWGPNWMKNRPPYNLQKILMIYNAVQVLACALIFIVGIRVLRDQNYRWVCQPVDFSDNEDAVMITRLFYFYYLLKILDLTDTIFFVLRKKVNQVTFLHVYHHAGMVALIWGTTTYYPGGHPALIGIINCFVHAIMYTYYFLTVAVPSVKQVSSCKKYITQLQILQFLMTIIHMSTIVFRPDCEFPRWTAAIFLPQNIFILILFMDFYIKSYIKKQTALVKPRVLNEICDKARETVETVEDKDKLNNGTIFETSIINRKQAWRSKGIART
ncbi:PREDICTED: elongation of very long chain fatty acids protein 7-like [Papilio xuthus]|uniref:Elongation of very long chain fatty acids protein n=1 Tax=Papilio xuthus TaxID=66420 RepID=A0AAJ6ZSC0_PAPXU|nr:PREDICTED: elongation of very long chain fatty acids protein 7-like [Papilio xuthus]